MCGMAVNGFVEYVMLMVEGHVVVWKQISTPVLALKWDVSHSLEYGPKIDTDGR